MCWWDSVSSVLYFCLNYQEHKWHFVNSQSEFISAHFTSSGKTLTAESATTMGKGKFNKCWLEHPEFSWLKAVLTNESEAQCTLCQRTLNFDALGVKALVSHTKSEKHQLASKSLQQSHTITHFCTPPSPVVQFCSTWTLHHLCCLTAKWHSNHRRLNSDVESGGVLDFEHCVRVCTVCFKKVCNHIIILVCVCVCVCVCVH